jgi:hypothetical protein
MTARLNPRVITTASLLLHHSPGHDLEAGAPENHSIDRQSLGTLQIARIH